MHGRLPTEIACRHVVSGVACGVNLHGEGPDDTSPVVMCDACSARYENRGLDGVRDDLLVLCRTCWTDARAHNHVPPGARGKRPRLTKREREVLFETACTQGAARQSAADARWHLGLGAHSSKLRWNWSQDARAMTFSHDGIERVAADGLLIGSFSTRTNTFQWAWETFGDCDPAAEAAARVRTFGEVRGIRELTTANFAADEHVAWHLTLLAGYLFDCEGFYRMPQEHVYWYMLLANFRTIT